MKPSRLLTELQFSLFKYQTSCYKLLHPFILGKRSDQVLSTCSLSEICHTYFPYRFTSVKKVDEMNFFCTFKRCSSVLQHIARDGHDTDTTESELAYNINKHHCQDTVTWNLSWRTVYSHLSEVFADCLMFYLLLARSF